MKELQEKPFYRPDQIAKYFNVNRSTVYGWIAEGKLNAVRLGGTIRVSRQAIKEFQRPAIE